MIILQKLKQQQGTGAQSSSSSRNLGGEGGGLELLFALPSLSPSLQKISRSLNTRGPLNESTVQIPDPCAIERKKGRLPKGHIRKDRLSKTNSKEVSVPESLSLSFHAVAVEGEAEAAVYISD